MRLKTFGDGVTPNEKCWVGIDQSYSGFAITVLSEDGSYETTVAKFDSSGGERLEEIQEHLLETMHRTVGVVRSKMLLWKATLTDPLWPINWEN